MFFCLWLHGASLGHFSETLFADLKNYVLVGQLCFFLFSLNPDTSLKKEKKVVVF